MSDGRHVAVSNPISDAPTGVSVQRESFGHAPDGTAVELFRLVNARGLEVRVITYGAIVQSLRVPDRTGRFDDIVLGHDDVAGYVESASYFGAIVGRYANRIAYGRFTLDGVTHQLTTNNGEHHLHGGVRGFDKVVWEADAEQLRDGAARVTLQYTSPDGDEGYPGTLTVRVSYTLTPRDELEVDYHATTDRATPVNLSQHSYFNLAGAGRGNVLEHELTIHAAHFTPVDAELVPTGTIRPVAGTPFDFRRSTEIGARITADDDQLHAAGGYDHNFVVARSGSGLILAARLAHPPTGRVLDVHTTEPGIQFYSGNFLDGRIRGKEGHVYGHRAGVCLETQHFPDSPNHPEFPSTVLMPGEELRSRTVFAFTVLGQAFA